MLCCSVLCRVMLLACVALWLASAALSVSAVTVEPTAPTTPTGPTVPAVSALQRACLDELKVAWGSRCFQLLSTGPCLSSEWLVLLPPPAAFLSPACRAVPCAEREVLWADGRCYQRFRDRERLCPWPGNLLVANPFGVGECACSRSPPHARLSNDSGACFPLFHPGPCPTGFAFLPVRDGLPDQGECRRDPCRRENSEATPGPPFVRFAGRCYRLGDSQLCPGDATFGVHPASLQPACLSRTNHLLPPTPCANKCAPTATSAYSDAYIKELFHKHQAHRRQ